MKSRYILSPEAGLDLLNIWRYVGNEASHETADRVESVILEKIIYLAGPGGGHSRKDLTDEPVRFFAVYSYLIAYLPETKPLQVVAILRGQRELRQLLRDRL
jgi:plasmid stabilization system protein ParE